MIVRRLREAALSLAGNEPIYLISMVKPHGPAQR